MLLKKIIESFVRNENSGNNVDDFRFDDRVKATNYYLTFVLFDEDNTNKRTNERKDFSFLHFKQ